MKVSEITNREVANYLRLEYDFLEPAELAELDHLIVASKRFIENYTGLAEFELDNYEEITHVVFVLCQDMYDNRSYYVDKNNINNMVSSILGMHSKNLL